ncbi:MAG: hypothetical protein L0241_04680 [Planctomycetia bacterium]|nr:hypothetical protein [Planctomycetia bacterium]
MTAPLYVTPGILTVPQPPNGSPELADLLRQLLAVQQEQLALVKAQLASQDSANRMRAFLARWNEEFPGLGALCKQVLPMLERAYLSLVRELTEKLAAESDDLSDEFVLSEFLDRYGMRLLQMGNILSQIGPLAESFQEKG